jgi:L-threonylcarbamoyladenylate synthase
MTGTIDLSAAIAALAAGGLVGLPTETVYGLAGDATNDRAVARIFAAKGRPSFNPLITHVATMELAFELGHFPPAAQQIAAAFWPGPLTLVVPRSAGCPVSLLASAGLSSLAIRIPAHPVALALLSAYGKPLVAPSANPSGRISPTTAEHVLAGLGNKVDVVIDGGSCAVGLESTVVSFMGERPALLRPGGLPRAAIEQVLGQPLAEAGGGTFHSPGMLESHYAPKATVRLEASSPQSGETYIGFGGHAHGSYNLSIRGDLTEAAANLFRLLHEIDHAGAKAIAVAPIPSEGLGEAINDRLRRAAAPRPAP